MDQEIADFVTKNLVKILNHVNPTMELLTFLESKGVITDDEKEYIVSNYQSTFGFDF